MVQENDGGWVTYDDGERPAKGGSGSSSDLFLKTVLREAPYRFRIVTPAIRFWKHFIAFKFLTEKSHRFPISPATNINEKYKDVAWEKGNHIPSKRFAMVVLDRDDGKVKILEVGGSVWGSFNDYANLTGINPADWKQGPDWILRVSKSDTRDGNEISCVADPRGSKPLTEEEQAEVNRFMEAMEKVSREKHDSDLGWKCYFKPLSPEKMRELWMSLPEDRRVAKKKEQKGSFQQPKTAEKTGTATAPAAKKEAAPPPPPKPEPEEVHEEPEAAAESTPTEEPFF